MSCVIVRNGEACGCTSTDRDATNTCTQCRHGNRWHGDAWKTSKGVLQPKTEPNIDMDAFFRACTAGELPTVKEFWDKLPDKNAKNASGDTGLHLAAANGHAELAVWMVQNGADPKVTDNGGQNVVMRAQDEGAMSVITALDEIGVSG
eukprot:TRINITY_DN46067_c0_g1_i1.p1 TRINITY_DN46067_c0_g1~~TRINITY_DN46067_c0_g1_i1.p1  ORF type:complete len:148 (-),score=20.69 TRINITY_DN46067_c0_g1_i1:29-472(-)